MRAKMAAIFALGFASGVLVLTLSLWFSGGLRISSVMARGNVPAALAPTAPPTPVPNPPSPVPEPPAPPPTIGTPVPLHLAMPIAGVDPEELEDTFNEVHSGHKHEALDIPAPRGTPVLAV